MHVCSHGYFQGSNGGFFPDAYLTKAGSLVALMRGLYPEVEFDAEADPYWTPYVTLAHELDITYRESGPYLMYLITRYELLLQLYRAYQITTE